MSRVSGIINKLEENEIFVFGSNEAGRHGKGAALLAMKWGAIKGISEGIQGQTYGIPTKNNKIKTLSINKIKKYVDNFIEYAKQNENFKFYVTEIGCGLAGYQPKDIAPLFNQAINLDNIYLPQKFWDVLNS
tara:strand:- start:1300 stop:1695 length:396 start_codon:yes stop_codon:yes gene_type:complete